MDPTPKGTPGVFSDVRLGSDVPALLQVARGLTAGAFELADLALDRGREASDSAPHGVKDP
jgi:hypothetical protein